MHIYLDLSVEYQGRLSCMERYQLLLGSFKCTILLLQVREQALQIARSLQDLGLKKGDIVGLILPNCLEYPVLVQGCLYLGITVTPINPGYTPHEISRQLKASAASIIFGHSSLGDKLKETLKLCPAVTKTVIVGDKVNDNNDFLHWNDFLTSSSLSMIPDPAKVDVKKDVAVLPFSSGTTGTKTALFLQFINCSISRCSQRSNVIPVQPCSWYTRSKLS